MFAFTDFKIGLKVSSMLTII